jgi:hypothetical protein
MELGVVEHFSNHSTLEAEVGGWRIRGQHGLHREIELKKKKKN